MKYTEKEFLAQVIQLARLFGWKVAHFRSVPVKRGGRIVWETPVQADGKGWPDLMMARHKLIAAELKVGKNKASPEQSAWLELLSECDVDSYLWRPEDWPQIEKVLKDAPPRLRSSKGSGGAG